MTRSNIVLLICVLRFRFRCIIHEYRATSSGISKSSHSRSGAREDSKRNHGGLSTGLERILATSGGVAPPLLPGRAIRADSAFLSASEGGQRF